MYEVKNILLFYVQKTEVRISVTEHITMCRTPGTGRPPRAPLWARGIRLTHTTTSVVKSPALAALGLCKADVCRSQRTPGSVCNATMP